LAAIITCRPDTPADAGDHPRARHLAVVQVARRQLADFEERRPGIEQPLDPLARQQLAAAHMPLPRLLVPAERRLRHVRPQFLRQRAVVRVPGAEIRAVGLNLAVDPRRAHGQPPSW
jgi:hypothetical protein